MLKEIRSICHKGCRIGYISDTHIETRNNKKAYINNLLTGEKMFDILVLAGDIGDPFCRGNYYQKFIEGCTNLADNVLLIAGNHEYYSSSTLKKFSLTSRYTMNQISCKIQSICDSINQTNADVAPYRGRVNFLENSCFHYKNKEQNANIIFIGTTLWSDIDVEYEKEISSNINDYHLILGFTPKLSRELFNKSQKYINHKICEFKTENPDSSIIIISHHAPTTKNVWNPMYDSNKTLNSAFGSNFNFTTHYRPDYWIFGHTHYDCYHYSKELGCHLLSNQVGYASEILNKQDNIKEVYK